MPTNRHKIDIHSVNIDWYFAYSLCSICMEENFFPPTKLQNIYEITTEL